MVILIFQTRESETIGWPEAVDVICRLSPELLVFRQKCANKLFCVHAQDK